MTKGTFYTIEVNPRIPRRLIRLEEMAGNLWYTWDNPARTLFARLHPGLWEATGHNPKAFLKRVDEQRLVDAAEDHVFLANYNRVLSAYDTYHNEPLKRDQSAQLKHSDMVAYFCAEFGFHESFPIYSGGLGILAGDHCKAASDMRLPFVGVGLLYRQGYFSQTIDSDGRQIAHYHDSDFDDLPVSPAYTDDGQELKVQVEFPGRNVTVKVWLARAGHVSLALLDTDLEENKAEDRDITHQLYGGDREMRIRQEIILGIGGARALAAMGVKPTVWHINEGHAAFLVLERIRQLMQEKQLDFNSALEAVAVGTVFTTHTPVPAGHDHFPGDMMERYFQDYCRQLGIPLASLHELGHTQGSPDFNMTALALHGSRHHNGVSRIHGGVSAEICGEHWSQIEPEENPVDYITNGVHVNTFLAHEWIDLFDNRLGYDWRHKLSDAAFWEEHIDRIPDHVFWSVRQTLKAQLFFMLKRRYAVQHARNHGSQAHLERLLELANPLDPKALTIGFARRFATYKRATLLFENLDWLKRIVSDEERPVLFLFAGKAHPADQPGQELIRRIHELSHLPELEGKLLPGHLVQVGFGTSMQHGIVLSLHDQTPPHVTKPVIARLDPQPVLNETQIEVARWMSSAYLAPLEGQSQGVVVVDGSMAGIGMLKAPIRITIENGLATAIEGGEDAARLRDLVAPFGDAGRNVAEFGIGTNDKAIVTGVILEDEKVMGTIHIAFGDNKSMGGTVRVASHLDGLVLSPSVWFDDRQVMDAGQLLEA